MRPTVTELVEAGAEDLPVVRRLMQLYVHDLSEHTGWGCRADGTFGDFLELADYWGDPEGFPFLIRADGELAGFAIVQRLEAPPDPLHDVAEFFVLRKYRGRGIGRTIALALFTRFPGRWQVRELLENTPAQAFWRRVIGQFTDGAYAETQEDYRSRHAGVFPMVWQRFAHRG